MELLQKIDWTLFISLLISILVHGILLNVGVLPSLEAAHNNSGQISKTTKVNFEVMTTAEALEQQDNSSKTKEKLRAKEELKTANKVKEKRERKKKVHSQETVPKENKEKNKQVKAANNEMKPEVDTRESKPNNDVKNNQFVAKRNVVKPPNRKKIKSKELTTKSKTDFGKIKEELQVQKTELLTGIKPSDNKVESKKEIKNNRISNKAKSDLVTGEKSQNEVIDLTQESKSNVSPPSLNKHTPPQYPRQLRKRGVEGQVKLKVLISNSGEVKRIRIKESSGYKKLDQSAQNAIKRWSFNPAQTDGHRIGSWILIPIKFKLD